MSFNLKLLRYFQRFYFHRFERFKRSIATETSDANAIDKLREKKKISSSVNEKSALNFKFMHKLFFVSPLNCMFSLCYQSKMTESSYASDRIELPTMNEINRM